MLLCLLFVHVSNSRPVVYKSQERIFKRRNRYTKTVFLFGKVRSLRYGKALTSSPIPIRSVSLFHSNKSGQAQFSAWVVRRMIISKVSPGHGRHWPLRGDCLPSACGKCFLHEP